MNITSLLRSLFLAFAFAFGAQTTPVAAGSAPAGDTVALAQGSRLNATSSSASASPVFAGVLQDVVGNRTRLIQMSFIFILVGIFILWKK